MKKVTLSYQFNKKIAAKNLAQVSEKKTFRV